MDVGEQLFMMLLLLGRRPIVSIIIESSKRSAMDKGSQRASALGGLYMLRGAVMVRRKDSGMRMVNWAGTYQECTR